jgi:putative cross-wall-targeting lipoprotein signal
MKKMDNVKGHGFMRKTKAFGLASGIALGATLLIGANTASADEATTATPSTTATANESKTVVVDEGLTETANKAKEAGLTVNAEPTKNIGTANTEEETAKLAEQAKKEVETQKAEIEKKTTEFKAQSQAGGVKRQEVIDNLSNNPSLYNTTGDGLRALADDAYNKGQASYGDFTSSAGTVRYLNAPSEFNADQIDPTIAVLNSAIGTTPKEITMKYAGGNVFSKEANSLQDRSSLKVVPILVNDGETITYKVNVSADSELGKLGVKTVERSLTLKGSPVGTGKIALLADRTGSVLNNHIFGGLGKSNEVMNNGKEFDVVSSWNYLDASGKAIDSKELTAKFVNAKWYPNLNIKASDIKLAPTTENKPHNLNYGTADTKTLSDTRVNGGSKFVESTTKYKLGEEYTAKHIDPIQNVMDFNSKLVEVVNNNYAKDVTAPTVNYHLVSYTVNKPTATNPNKDAKGLVEVHYVVDNTERTVLKEPVIQTPESPIGTKYDTTSIKLPTITKDGKTYEVVRSEGTEKGQVVKGKTVVTYLYKLKEEPKPTPTPTPVENPTTIHIDGDSGKEIAPPEKGTKPFKNIDGYEPSPKDPKNVEDPKGETVRVYNRIKKGNVEVRYVKDDASKTVLKDPVADTVDGKVGSDYDTTDHKPTTITKDGVTYELVRTEGVEKGKVVEGKTVVTYVYRQTVEPTTVHIDEEGNRIAPPEKGTKPFKNIDGFEPSPKDPKNVENPKGETVRVYKIVKGDVEVRYVKDDKERTVLKDPVADTTQAKVGTKYDTTDHKPVTITKDGVTYELVRTEGNEKGDVVKGKTVVTYVYREVQKPITIHIDTEGNPVAPQEDGTKPFKEIEGYKPAPSDSKNVEDPKGVTVRVYDKVKPEAPQEAPKTPEKPQPQQPATQAVATNQLPHTGSEAGTALAIAGLGLLGLGGLVYKKKEN